MQQPSPELGYLSWEESCGFIEVLFYCMFPPNLPFIKREQVVGMGRGDNLQN
jgi:hypothetical protein